MQHLRLGLKLFIEDLRAMSPDLMLALVALALMVVAIFAAVTGIQL